MLTGEEIQKMYTDSLNKMNKTLTDYASPEYKRLLKQATDAAEEVKRAEEAPRLKVFEVVVDPILSRHSDGDWVFVMVLAKDDSSAVDYAFEQLALPNGRMDLKWTVTERKGPFVNGSVLSIKTIPAK